MKNTLKALSVFVIGTVLWYLSLAYVALSWDVISLIIEYFTRLRIPLLVLMGQVIIIWYLLAYFYVYKILSD